MLIKSLSAKSLKVVNEVPAKPTSEREDLLACLEYAAQVTKTKSSDKLIK